MGIPSFVFFSSWFLNGWEWVQALFFVFRQLRGVYKLMSFLRFFLEGWGVGRILFLFCFLKAHGSMLCIFNPQKKMNLYTAPNLPNKKRVIIHPAILQKQKEKTCYHPSILQNPKKMMFSHRPLPSKNLF